MSNLTCEGACDRRTLTGHYGMIRPVIVNGPPPFDDMHFNYCEAAVKDDRECGFEVIEEVQAEIDAADELTASQAECEMLARLSEVSHG